MSEPGVEQAIGVRLLEYGPFFVGWCAVRLKVAICAFVSVLFLISDTLASPLCYVVDREGVEHRIARWNRLVAREVERPVAGAESGAVGALDSPGVLTAFVYRAAVIPLEDIKFLLPALGIYVLGDGHRIEAEPLAECGFSREHRFVDLERSRHRSTAGGMESPFLPRVPLLLEVFIEYAATDTVAGYPVAEPRMIPIHDAWVVAFDSEAIEEAVGLWTRYSSESESEISFSPFSTYLQSGAKLRLTPDGDDAGRLKEDTPVEVLEIQDEWVRVKVEGWVKKEAVEEKDR